MLSGGNCIYLVAPHAGFFGNEIVKSILHFRISWNEQQQVPHTKCDPGGFRRNRKNRVKRIRRFPPGCNIPFGLNVYLHSSRLASW